MAYKADKSCSNFVCPFLPNAGNKNEERAIADYEYGNNKRYDRDDVCE